MEYKKTIFLVFRDRNGGENVTEKVGAVLTELYVGMLGLLPSPIECWQEIYLVFKIGMG